MSIRNRCILEMLYSCGLRVSELVNLRCSDLFFEEGLVKVIGKGDKERFVQLVELDKKLSISICPFEWKEKGHSDILFSITEEQNSRAI